MYEGDLEELYLTPGEPIGCAETAVRGVWRDSNLSEVALPTPVELERLMRESAEPDDDFEWFGERFVLWDRVDFEGDAWWGFSTVSMFSFSGWFFFGLDGSVEIVEEAPWEEG